MIFFFVAVTEFFRLRQFPDPSGADGYFYLKQIQSLSEHANFYYKDYSFAFFLPSVLNVFLRDPLLSYQITVCFFFGAIGSIVYRLTRHLRFKRSFFWRWMSMIFISAFILNNPLYFELNLVFLKTATAIFFYLAACDRLLMKKNKSGIVFGVLALLSHKVMIIIIPISILLFIFQQLRNFRLVGILAGFMIAAAISGFIFYPGFSDHLNHALLRADWEKLSLESLLQSFYGKAALLGAVSGVLALTLTWGSRAAWFYVVSGLILIAPLAIPDPLNTNSISFRFLVMSVPFFLLTISGSVKRGGWFRATGIVLATISLIGTFEYQRKIDTWVVPWSKRIPKPEEINQVVPTDALLYAPHGVEFYLAYKTPLRPRSFIVSEQGREVFRVAYVAPYKGNGSLAENDMTQLALLELGPEFSVFKESAWLLINDLYMFRPHPMNLLDVKPGFVADY
ncbi:MAG: hypothetical protein V4736_02985 [Bdellovibrionota bacterium]